MKNLELKKKKELDDKIKRAENIAFVRIEKAKRKRAATAEKSRIRKEKQKKARDAKKKELHEILVVFKKHQIVKDDKQTLWVTDSKKIAKIMLGMKQREVNASNHIKLMKRVVSQLTSKRKTSQKKLAAFRALLLNEDSETSDESEDKSAAKDKSKAKKTDATEDKYAEEESSSDDRVLIMKQRT